MRSGMDVQRPRRACRDDGAALVEFAIIMPVLVMLILGMITGGFALSQKNSMTNAVREGARLGATVPNDPDWATHTRQRVIDLAAGDLTLEQVCVQLARKDATGETVHQSAPVNCPAAVGTPPAFPAGTGVDDCVVKVWARRTSDLNALVFRYPLTLEATAVARFERGVAGVCNP
jgi:Flp pilus assembly protein TadG